MIRAYITRRMFSPRHLRIGRELGWVIVGQVSAAAGSLVGLRVLTNALGPAAFGELALGLTVVTLIGLIVFAGPGLAAMRFFGVAMESHQLDSFLRAALRVLLGRTYFMVALLIIVVAGLLITRNDAWIELVISAFIAALFTSFTTVLDGIQNAARQRTIVAWHSGLYQWLRFLIALALFPILGRRSATAMWGYALAAALVLFSQYLFFLFFRRRVSVQQSPVQKVDVVRWTHQIAEYARPVSMYGIFGWLQASSERWALQYFASTADVGLYAALAQVGYGPMVLISNVAAQLVAPIVFNRAGDGSDVDRMKSSRRLNIRLIVVFGIGTLLAVAMSLLFNQVLFRILVAPEFRQVAYLMPIMVLSGGLFACGEMASYLLMSGTHTRGLIVPKAVSSVLGIALAFMGAYLFGVAGVACASAVFSLSYMLLVIWQAMRNRSPKSHRTDNISDAFMAG